MNAKEMFERLGYTYQESYFEEKIDRIRYIKPKKIASCILFDLDSKCFKIFRYDNEYKSGWCDLKILQAINKQIEELNWNK